MIEKNETLNENVEEENDITESSTVEAQATGDIDETNLESADKGEGESKETVEGSKKGYSHRVRELNTRAKEAEAKAESLASKLKELTSIPESRGYDFNRPEDNDPIVRPDEEIDAVELDKRLRDRESRILAKADALSTLRGKQQDAISRINREAESVMRKYPELDTESEGFNKELSEAISEATEAYVMKNPYDASVTKFVDKMMRPYKGAVSKEVGNMTGSMAKQVSEAATRPTSVRKEEKPAREKSIAELEAELGMVQA